MDILTSISFWLSIAFLISAAGAIYAVYRFGRDLTAQEMVKFYDRCYIHKRLAQSPQERQKVIQELADSYRVYLKERNDFWEKYGQIIISIVIITVLAVLLVTKTISAEAGLPILSAVGGFAIAKTASVSNQDKPTQPEKPE